MTTETETIVVRDEGNLRVILLNRPTAANALDIAMLDALVRALHEVADCAARAVVIAGCGRNFCAGSDLKAARADPAGMSLRLRFNPLALALDSLNIPVVAAVNGAAAGGGLALALMADMRVMGEGARLVPSWLPLGLVPDLGASWHIAQALGPARAFDWLARATPMKAAEAMEYGLANRVVADGSELVEAIALARELAAIPGPAIALTRQLLRNAAGRTLAQQLEAEAQGQDAAMRDSDQIAALAARVEQLGRSR